MELILDKVYWLYEPGADEYRVENYVRRWGQSGLEVIGLLGLVASTQQTSLAIALERRSLFYEQAVE